MRELTLQKRDVPELFKQLKRPAGALVYRWMRVSDKVVGGTLLA